MLPSSQKCQPIVDQPPWKTSSMQDHCKQASKLSVVSVIESTPRQSLPPFPPGNKHPGCNVMQPCCGVELQRRHKRHQQHRQWALGHASAVNADCSECHGSTYCSHTAWRWPMTNGRLWRCDHDVQYADSYRPHQPLSQYKIRQGGNFSQQTSPPGRICTSTDPMGGRHFTEAVL